MSDNPIIHGQMAQILVRHYKMEAGAAAKEADRLIEILELNGLQVIRGEWVEPEVVYVAPKTGWDKLASDLADIEESGRKPWLTYELTN